MIIFHFVGGLRAVFTMIFAMFSARFLQHFYRVSARFLYFFTRYSARLLQYLCKVFCEAFTTYVTRCFARLLQYFYKVFCEAVTVCLQGVQNRCATAVKPCKALVQIVWKLCTKHLCKGCGSLSKNTCTTVVNTFQTHTHTCT